MIYLPWLLKPAPTQLRLVLWAVVEGFADFPIVPSAGLVTIPALKDMPSGYHWRAGYQELGDWAVRIDMLERLANMIRECDVKEGFESHCDMLSITGASLETFAAMMQELGYSADKHTRMKVAVAEDAGDDVAEAVAEAVEEVATEADKTKADTTEPTPTEPNPPEPNEEIYYIFKRKPFARAESPKTDSPAKFKTDKGKNFGRKVFANKNDKGKNAGGKKSHGAGKDHKPPHKQPIDPDNPFAQLKALKLTMND